MADILSAIYTFATKMLQDTAELRGILFSIISVTIPLLLAVAYLTYFERKIIAAMQIRQGPSLVGPFGLLQPFADAIKLMSKENIIPAKANKLIFFKAPILTFVLALIGWAVIPFGAHTEINAAGNTVIIPKVIANINLGVLYLLAISSMGVYGIIMAGWASNSKYAFLGAIRSAAQMISYEIPIGLIIIAVLLMAGSLNLTDIVLAQVSMPWWQKLLMVPMAVIFFISILAETNRHPFDLPEAESELVAGYNVEYSSIPFALFFLGEYANMILMSAVMSILFLGGWYPPLDIGILYKIPGLFWLILKICFILFMFIWVRATLPRYRYDQLMSLGWKIFIPITLFSVSIIAGQAVYW